LLDCSDKNSIASFISCFTCGLLAKKYTSPTARLKVKSIASRTFCFAPTRRITTTSRKTAPQDVALTNSVTKSHPKLSRPSFFSAIVFYPPFKIHSSANSVTVKPAPEPAKRNESSISQIALASLPEHQPRWDTRVL
jgi:hypothetical protein